MEIVLFELVFASALFSISFLIKSVSERKGWSGVESFTREQFNELMSVDRDIWQQELLAHEELFVKLYGRLPKELLFIHELILSSLWRSPKR